MDAGYFFRVWGSLGRMILWSRIGWYTWYASVRMQDYLFNSAIIRQWAKDEVLWPDSQCRGVEAIVVEVSY